MVGPQVLCLGEGLWDCLAEASSTTIDHVQGWTLYPGGSLANVACALQKLGTSTAFVGCVGSDPLGQALIEQLQAVGVDLQGVQIHPSAPTRQIQIFRDAAGDRFFADVKEQDLGRFADAHLQARQLPRALFETAQYLVLGTVGLAHPETRAAMAQALTWADQFFLKVVVDLNWRPTFWPNPAQAPQWITPLLQRCDFLKVSAEEAQWFFNTLDPQVIATQLSHLEGVMVTHGAEGCAYCFQDLVGTVPGLQVSVVDTTGAGDGFLAGFIHQLQQQGIAQLQNPDIVTSIIQYASAVGALTTTAVGAIAAQPTAAAVEAFLATQFPNPQ